MEAFVRFESIDPARNRKRWYELERRGVRILRRWGRLGQRGREKVDACGTPQTADLLYRRLVRRRELHGYVRASGATQMVLVAEAA